MKKYIYLSLILLGGLFTACTEGPDYSDKVFVTGTLSNEKINFNVFGTTSTGITITSTAKTETPITAKLAPAPELLDAYNEKMERNYQLPPADSYSLSTDVVTIETGKSISTPVVITAQADKLKDGVSYCLPVTIQSCNGQGILETSRTAYVVFVKVIETKVAQMNGGAYFDIPSFNTRDGGDLWALNALTLECKVRPSNLSSSLAESSINPIMGSHESLLLRFGDGSNIPANKLNFAKVSIGTDYHPDNKPHYESTFEETFENDQWYHVAVVYDGSKVKFYLNGELKIEKNTTGGQINLAMSYGGHGWDDTFAIGRSYGTHWTYKGCISEVRIWNKARSIAEIQDGVCYVDPSSDGLVSYWRFNGELQDDGTVRDETGHGHDAHPTGRINWVENQKCPF